MTQLTTDRYESLLQLNASQVIAIETLDAGGTHQEAADAAGVNRVTVTRWVHHHPAFQAEWNRRRFERLEYLAARAENVTAAAFDVVAQAIDAGDVATALAWVRMTYSGTNTQSGSSLNAPLTPGAVIDGAAESISMREPMEAYTKIFREAAVDRIHAELEA